MVDEDNSDEQQWLRAIAGDTAARELVAARADRHARDTMRRRRVPARDLDDLAQEVAIGVERCRKNGTQIRVFRKFVYFRTLATLKEHRARKRRDRVVPGDLPEAMSSLPVPDEQASRHELIRAVATCRDALPPTLRTVLHLRHTQNLLMREIAEHTELSLGGVRERFRRAWERMQHCLRARGFELGGDDA